MYRWQRPGRPMARGRSSQLMQSESSMATSIATSFADRLKQLLMTDGDYSEWAGEKRAEMEEALKKRAREAGHDAMQKKIIGE